MLTDKILAKTAVLILGLMMSCHSQKATEVPPPNDGNPALSESSFEGNADLVIKFKSDNPKLWAYFFKTVLSGKAIKDYEDAVHFYGSPWSLSQESLELEPHSTVQATRAEFKGFDVVFDEKSRHIHFIDINRFTDHELNLGDPVQKVFEVLGRGEDWNQGIFYRSNEFPVNVMLGADERVKTIRIWIGTR